MSKTDRRMPRRTFVRGAAAMGLALPLAGARLVRAQSPNAKLRHACIGVGGMMGPADRSSIASHKQVEIAALCDVDANHLNGAAGQHPHAAKYADWRELLAKEGDKIDSVNVTTPDHMHAAIAMSALHAGKHVWTQKPMCHDVAEVRALTKVAAAKGVVTQLGTQHASGMGDRLAVAFMQMKLLGKAKRLVLCSNRPGAINDYRLVGPRPAQGSEPPAHLNWDLWLGTAPQRPFAPGIYHPVKWRAWQDFGTGWSGDIGCHIFNAPWKGLGLAAPKSVTADVQESWRDDPARRADTWPQSDHITWVFPESEFTDGELIVEWFDGTIFPPQDVQKLAETDQYPPESFMLIGTEGNLLLPHGSGPRLLPSAKYPGEKRPKVDLPPQNHWHNFVDACLGNAKPESPFAVAGPMSETVLLGTVAIRNPGKTLEWDAANMRFTNSDDANKLLRREYRDGWKVEGL